MSNLPTIEERHFIIGKVARTIFIDRLHKEHNGTIFVRCPEIQDVISLTSYLEDIFDRLSFPIPKHFDTSKITKEIYTSDFNNIKITVNDKDNYANITVSFNDVLIWDNKIPLKPELLTIKDLELFHFDRISNNHKFLISTCKNILSNIQNNLTFAFTPCEEQYYKLETINKYWSCNYNAYLKEYCNFIYQIVLTIYCISNNLKVELIIQNLNNIDSQMELSNYPNIIYMNITENGELVFEVFGTKGLVTTQSYIKQLKD